jgi:hypothetical protein
MAQEIFVPKTEIERKNVIELALYLDNIFYC